MAFWELMWFFYFILLVCLLFVVLFHRISSWIGSRLASLDMSLISLLVSLLLLFLTIGVFHYEFSTTVLVTCDICSLFTWSHYLLYLWSSVGICLKSSTCWYSYYTFAPCIIVRVLIVDLDIMQSTSWDLESWVSNWCSELPISFSSPRIILYLVFKYNL